MGRLGSARIGVGRMWEHQQHGRHGCYLVDEAEVVAKTSEKGAAGWWAHAVGAEGGVERGWRSRVERSEGWEVGGSPVF